MPSRIDHVGVFVADLEAALGFLRNTFGLSVERVVEEPERHLSARFLRWGDVAVELVAFDDDRVREQRLGGAPARIDHIAVAVEDLDAEIKSLRARGVSTATERPIVLGGARTIFIDAEGVRYQLIEARQ